MQRLVRLASFLFAAPFLTRAAEAPAISTTATAAPSSAPGASGPSLVASPEGVMWLTWLEKTGHTTALRFATLEPSKAHWSPAATIASGTNWFVNWADFPALTVGPGGRATAVWFVNNPAPAAPAAAAASHDHHGPGYRAFISHTTDAGRTWSAPAPLTRDSDSVEFVSLATLADGRVLAAWLDGRAKKTGLPADSSAKALATAEAPAKAGGKAQQLFARIIGASGPDTLVDDSVCDCCQTSLTAFPDGTALLTYRARRDGEVRDIHVTRFRGTEWDESRTLNSDDWRIAGCPVNGPQLVSDGGRVAVSWFTGADNDPRVLTSFSPDAGARFLMPLRLTEGKTLGRTATTLLHDGAILVTFVDADGALWLRRVTPDFAATEPVRLATAEPGRIKGFPRVALRRDYAGGKDPAKMIVAFTREGVAGLTTLEVSVPEGDLLEAEKNCDCAPTADQLEGFPIRGSILSAEHDAGTLRVKHFEVPGIFTAGDREFIVSAETLARSDQAGRQFLGRIEKRNGAWTLFDVRFIASAPVSR